MTYEEMLALVAGLENGSEISAAIRSKVKSILDDSKKTKEDLRSAQDLINHFSSVTKAEGETSQAKSKDAQAKFDVMVKDLEKYKKENETLTQNKTELEEKVKKSERRELISDACKTLKGANADVITALIKDDIKLEVKGDKATVEGVEFGEYLSSNFKSFLPAIYPNGSATDDDDQEEDDDREDEKITLPRDGASANGKNNKPEDLLAGSRFAIPGVK